MKVRDSLLRLKKFRIEDLESRLATLDEMKADLKRKLTDLDESVAREKQRASDSEIGRLAFPSFLQSIETRRNNISATMRELTRERETVEYEINAAIKDLESFEAAELERHRRMTEAAERNAHSRSENLALVRHLKKHPVRRF
jgi:flagellar FliJ protein